MTARLIDGKTASAALKQSVAAAVAQLKAKHGLVPGLATVLVGDDGASQVYVASKQRTAHELGMMSVQHDLPAGATQDEVLALVERLNADRAINGILVQMPMPKQISAYAVQTATAVLKDVDGLHPESAGRLVTGGEGLVPCTPLGAMMMIKANVPDLAGKTAVVVGRSNLVGKPIAHLLLNANCTVTVAHSKTKDLPAVCRTADILVVAAGQREMVRGDWIKPGATVIDVGIHRIPQEGKKDRLVGDVAFAEAAQHAGAIAPVPGGVGLMTVACLMVNTLKACCLQHGITDIAIPSTLPKA